MSLKANKKIMKTSIQIGPSKVLLNLILFLLFTSHCEAQKLYAFDYDSLQSGPFETHVDSYALDSSSKFLSIIFENNIIASTDNEGNILWAKQVQYSDSDLVIGGDDTLYYHYFTTNNNKYSAVLNDKSTDLILEERMKTYTYPNGIQTLQSDKSGLNICNFDSLGNLQTSYCYYDSINLRGGSLRCKSNSDIYFEVNTFNLNGFQNSGIARLSKDGDLKFLKVFPQYSLLNLIFACTHDYLFLIARDSSNLILFMKMDTLGNIVDCKKIDNFINITPKKIVVLNNGLMGISFEMADTKTSCGFILLDTNLQIASAKIATLDNSKEDFPAILPNNNSFIYSFYNNKPTVNLGWLQFDTTYQIAYKIDTLGNIFNSKLVYKLLDSYNNSNNSGGGEGSGFVFGQDGFLGNHISQHYHGGGIQTSSYKFYSVDGDFNTCQSNSSPIVLKDSNLVLTTSSYVFNTSSYNLLKRNRPITINPYIDRFKMLCSTSIGINDVTNSYSKIFINPNPANSFFNIRYDIPTNENLLFVLYDSYGKEVLRKNLYGTFKNLLVHTEQLNNGIYFWRAVVDYTTKTQRSNGKSPEGDLGVGAQNGKIVILH